MESCSLNRPHFAYIYFIKIKIKYRLRRRTKRKCSFSILNAHKNPRKQNVSETWKCFPNGWIKNILTAGLKRKASFSKCEKLSARKQNDLAWLLFDQTKSEMAWMLPENGFDSRAFFYSIVICWGEGGNISTRVVTM